uniref:Uncharacterized protein n=1 Tax=Timema monikensis TaxID=170555 RepID=A0A7R9ED51_9NEOP|nr:unnamed protein product [Timema monikensis]
MLPAPHNFTVESSTVTCYHRFMVESSSVTCYHRFMVESSSYLLLSASRWRVALLPAITASWWRVAMLPAAHSFTRDSLSLEPSNVANCVSKGKSEVSTGETILGGRTHTKL